MMTTKKLLSLILATCLLTTTHHIACSASAQALRYLKMAAAATWQDMKNGGQWMAKNPYKVTGSLFAASTYSAVEMHQSRSDQQANHLEAVARAMTDPNAPAIKMIHDTCKEHGVNDPLVLVLADQPHCDLVSSRNNNRMFILITMGAFHQMSLDLEGQPSDFKMKHWKALLVHEIKHLLANDSRKGIISEATLRTEKFKAEAFTALTVGTGVHAITKGRAFLSKIASPKVRATAAGFLTIQGLIVAKTMAEIEKKSTIFTDAANEWSKWHEQRADNYIHETAFKTKKPQLLDDFAEFFETHIKRGDLPQCPAHPLIEKRAQDARDAAAELRALMEKGEVENMSIETDCSPF